MTATNSILLGSEAIVVGYDFDEAAGHSIEMAFQMANITGATVHVVHVATPMADAITLGNQIKTKSITMEEGALRLKRAVEDYLEHFTSEHQLRNLQQAYSHLRVGDAVEEILSLANEVGATLIVVGVNRHNRMHDLLVGSTTQKLIRRAPCPVLVPHSTHTEEEHVQHFAPSVGQPSTLGRRHIYHHVPRNVRAQANHPLLIPVD